MARYTVAALNQPRALGFGVDGVDGFGAQIAAAGAAIGHEVNALQRVSLPFITIFHRRYIQVHCPSCYQQERSGEVLNPLVFRDGL